MQARLLARCFAARGHQVVIAGYAVPNAKLVKDTCGSTKIETVHLPVISFGRYFRAASFCFSLFRFLISRKDDFDLIICSTFKDATIEVALLKWMGLLNLPLVVRCEGFGDSGDAHFIKALPGAKWIISLLNRACNAVNSPSPRIEAELTALGLRSVRWSRILNGVPLPQPRQPVEIPIHAPRSFLFVGRMVPQKGASDLLRAVGELKDSGLRFRLNLVGDGPLYRRMQRLAMDLAVDDIVSFHGLVDPEQVVRHYRTNDFLVLPSRQEAFGMVAAEAMSYGLPVVVTSSGGPEYYVDRRVGRVCPPGDVAALAAVLKEMIQMPAKALQDMGSEARKIVRQRFEIQNIADRFLDLFLKVVPQKPG